MLLYCLHNCTLKMWMNACVDTHWPGHYPLLLLHFNRKGNLKDNTKIASHHESLKELGLLEVNHSIYLNKALRI